MTVLCGECGKVLYSPFLGIITAKKQNGEFVMDDGLEGEVCYSHRKKPREMHSLDELPEGAVVRFDRRTCNSRYGDGRVAWSVPHNKTRVLGYLTVQEAKEHLPRLLDEI